MKIQEFRNLIREEVEKSLTEAALITLPPNYQITKLNNNKNEYVLMLRKPKFTIAEAEQIAATLNKEFAKMTKQLQAEPMKGKFSKATIFIGVKGVSIGLGFVTKLSFDQLKAKVAGDKSVIDPDYYD